MPAALALRRTRPPPMPPTRDGGGAASGGGSGGRVSVGKAATSAAGSCASHMAVYLVVYPLAGWERVRWRVARRHSCCMVSW